jgi:hypothetical protein
MSNTYADGANALNRNEAAAVSVSPASGTSSVNISTATSTQIKTGAGTFYGLSVNTPEAGATATIYDGTDNTGKLLGTYPLTAAGPLNAPANGLPFSVGLFVVTAGGSPANVTVLYA